MICVKKSNPIIAAAQAGRGTGLFTTCPREARWPRPCIRSSRAPTAQRRTARDRRSCGHHRRVRRQHHRYRALRSNRRPLSNQPDHALVRVSLWRRERYGRRRRCARMLVECFERSLLDTGGAGVRAGRTGSDRDGRCQSAAECAIRHGHRQRPPRHRDAGSCALPICGRSIGSPHHRQWREVRGQRVHRQWLRMVRVEQRRMGTRPELVTYGVG